MSKARFTFFYFAGLLFLVSPLKAQESNSDLQGTSQSDVQRQVDRTSNDWDGTLSVESLQYPTEVQNDPRLNQNLMIEGAIKGSWETGWARSGIDVHAGRSGNLNYDYFAVQEFYSEYKSSSGMFSVAFGRKLEFWNQADRDWDLGLWEPLFQHDGLRMHAQGLTGIFLGVETPQIQFLAFATPIFIPTMTPEIAERDGAIVSESRWFRSLPKSQSLVGKETQLVYDLQIPAIAELIQNPGAGARLRVGGVDAGPWASIAYSIKAVNALSYRYDASVLTPSGLVATAASPKAEIELNPITHRHQILAVDVGYRSGPLSLGASVVSDEPQKKQVNNRLNSKGFETDYIQQQIQAVTIVTAHVASQNEMTWFNRKLAWRLDYLRGFSKESIDLDSRGIEQSRLISDRLQFTHAAAASVSSKILGRLSGTFRYLREFDQLGSLLGLRFEYAPQKNWMVALGGDLLSVDDPEGQAVDTRFLNRYRQNDRVYGGLSYVF